MLTKKQNIVFNLWKIFDKKNIFLIWGKYHSQVFDVVLNVSNEIGIIIKGLSINLAVTNIYIYPALVLCQQANCTDWIKFCYIL
jgi:hypothetical protein